ncbi:MAG: hypothetical protein KF870_07490 [Leadbetterella sp.]|nr:hypothetical protein [Leadbetterella sp.]
MKALIATCLLLCSLKSYPQLLEHRVFSKDEKSALLQVHATIERGGYYLNDKGVIVVEESRGSDKPVSWVVRMIHDENDLERGKVESYGFVGFIPVLVYGKAKSFEVIEKRDIQDVLLDRLYIYPAAGKQKIPYYKDGFRNSKELDKPGKAQSDLEENAALNGQKKVRNPVWTFNFE